MSLHLAHHPVLLAVLLAAALAFAWWTYGRMVPRVPARRRALLAGLRAVALALVLLLLFEPVLRLETAREEPPVVVVLVDRTQSLGREDGDGRGAREAREALRALSAPLDEAPTFAFADDLRPLPGRPADAAATLVFDGTRTDLSAALQGVQERFAGRNLRGVVLISDGRYNTGRSPLALADRFPAPIHTVVVGDTVRPRDVRLAHVTTNEIAYAGAVLPVRVAVQADGFAGRPATVTLSEAGRPLAQTTLALPEDGAETTVELALTPTGEGLRRYEVTVSHLEGEATYANNATAVAVRVLPARRRVLLLAAAPGPDVAALRMELEADPDVDLTARTARGPGTYYEGAFPDDLGRYDLVVLAGFPGRATSRADAEAVGRAAETGLPLLFVLTQQTDLETLAATLGDALPARPSTARPGFAEAAVRPTDAGALHPVLSVPGADGLERLPPLLLAATRWTPSPDSRVLATPRVAGVGLDDPVLLVRQRGRARAAALLGAGSWRWRTLPADLDDLAGVYPGLLQNLTRWLTAARDDRPVRVRPTQPTFDTTEPVRFTGQVYDEALEPVPDAELTVTVVGPEGALPFPLRPLGAGRFEGTTRALPPGTYTYEAAARRGGQLLGTDRGAFAVEALALELRDTYADVPLLRELARRTGGEHLHAAEAPTLAARLAPDLVPRRVPTERETMLWRFAPLLALAVGLLAAEWVLRKRSGMV